MDEHETPDGGAAALPAIPLDKLARAYRKLRSEIAAVQEDYDTKMEDLKGQQQQIKNAMKDIMLALGAGTTSIRTSEGTVVLSVKTRYNTQDWAAFDDFIVDHRMPQLLERRIHQGNMAQWLAENPGKVPPGLNTFSEYDVSVRKPTN